MITQKENVRALPQQFERMFSEYHDLVYRTAYRVTGNAEDAEDVLQTLFLRLLRRDFTDDLARSPKAYLHRAAVNIALDVVKIKNRNVPADELETTLEDSRPAPDRNHNSKEIEATLRAGLAQLSPKTAEMFVLRHIEGYDNDEIAKMMGTSKGTVAVMLFRARLRLRKFMKKHVPSRD